MTERTVLLRAAGGNFGIDGLIGTGVGVASSEHRVGLGLIAMGVASELAIYINRRKEHDKHCSWKESHLSTARLCEWVAADEYEYLWRSWAGGCYDHWRFVGRGGRER
jgi:hypothetical protein